MERKCKHNANCLWIARKKAGFGQKTVARLLGYKSISSISAYETGRLLPGLRTAFKLSIIYGVPLSELYLPFYEELRREIETRRCNPSGTGRTGRPESLNV